MILDTHQLKINQIELFLVPLKEFYLISKHNSSASIHEIVSYFTDGYMNHLKRLVKEYEAKKK